MKFKIQFEGDLYEDKQELRQLALLSDIICAIDEVKDLVRTRLKYSDEPMSDGEIKLLEDIYQCLHIKGLE